MAFQVMTDQRSRDSGIQDQEWIDILGLCAEELTGETALDTWQMVEERDYHVIRTCDTEGTELFYLYAYPVYRDKAGVHSDVMNCLGAAILRSPI